ncbi:DUF1851 domain-containing protein [Flavisolibacter nicotianae]|uniref:DUF1851 domain-containing protein n=1 Tax=Flavisolibacter nicotianae TaxID=2364882 RepID=UPI0013C40013|nr:DUF1851 domain-containing protein [Flavisolibacter nicotianae]
MTLTINQLTKDITSVNIEDILSCWMWKVAEMHALVTMSVLGDLFLLGKDDAVYWLQTDSGNLTKVANTFSQYKDFLNNEEKVNEWFLPLFVAELVAAGKTLKQNEVYSYKKLPVIGGEYSVENIEPTDMSVHFAFSGQICEQIKDLPDRTEVRIKVKQ